MSFKDVARRLYQKLFINSDGYIKYLRSCGIKIGEDVTFHSPNDTHVDITDPHLLTIGNHVNLTGPVTILTHDYSWSVIKGKTGEIFGNEKPVAIGNNVFIGSGAKILGNIIVGDNVKIVWGGVPARRICSLEQYREKRAAAQVAEAREYVLRFRSRWGRNPRPEEIREYFMLFMDREHLCRVHESQMGLMGTLEKSMGLLREKRPYQDFDSFLNDCR